MADKVVVIVLRTNLLLSLRGKSENMNHGENWESMTENIIIVF